MERRVLAEAHVARGHGAGVGAVAGDDRILERRAVIGNRAVVVGLRQLGEHIVVRVAAVGGFLPVVAEDVVRVRLHGDVRAVGLGDQFLHFIFGQGLFGFHNRRHTVDVVEGYVNGLNAGERFRRRDLRGHAFEVAVRHAGFRRDVRHPFIPDVGAGHDAVVGRGEVLAEFDCFAVDLDFGDVDEVAGEGRFAVRNADRHERNTGDFAVLNAGEVKGQGVGAGAVHGHSVTLCKFAGIPRGGRPIAVGKHQERRVRLGHKGEVDFVGLDGFKRRLVHDDRRHARQILVVGADRSVGGNLGNPFVHDVHAGFHLIVRGGVALSKRNGFAVDTDIVELDGHAGEELFAVLDAQRGKDNAGSRARFSRGEVQTHGVVARAGHGRVGRLHSGVVRAPVLARPRRVGEHDVAQLQVAMGNVLVVVEIGDGVQNLSDYLTGVVLGKLVIYGERIP